MLDIFVVVLISIVLLGAPTLFMVKAMKKAESSETYYSPDEVTVRLRRGFFMSNWGIDFLLGMIPGFAILLCDVSEGVKISLIAASFILGFALLFIGRFKVGMTTRYLNFCNRETTDLEKWVVNEMLDIEDSAMTANFFNSITRVTPGVTDDIIAAKEGSSGIISGFRSVSKVYTGKNIFKNHWPVILILAIVLTFLGITFL